MQGDEPREVYPNSYELDGVSLIGSVLEKKDS